MGDDAIRLFARVPEFTIAVLGSLTVSGGGMGNGVTFSWKNSISAQLESISNITERIGATSAG